MVVEEGDSKLTVRWDAVPDEEGKPSVTGYEVRYRERPDAGDSPSDEWAGIQKTSNRLDTSVTITGLLNGQAYLVSVRTLVDGGMSEWTSPVLGIPVIPAAGPVFPGGGGGGGGGRTSPPPADNSPDLTFIALVVTRSPFIEDLSVPFAFTLEATVENEGNGPSAATTLRYYRSTDATYSTDDTQVGTDDVDGLAASGTSREEINLTTQPSDGTYYIACIDAVAGESNTENNCHSIQVGTAPSN